MQDLVELLEEAEGQLTWLLEYPWRLSKENVQGKVTEARELLRQVAECAKDYALILDHGD